jgi:hypothetical protein
MMQRMASFQHNGASNFGESAGRFRYFFRYFFRYLGLRPCG